MERITLDQTNQANRQEWSWTELMIKRAEDLAEIVNSLRDYWPLTVRQVYYQLISTHYIQNTHWFKYADPTKGRPKDLFQAVSNQLKWMRIGGKIPWKSINDEHRIAGDKPGWDDMEAFLNYIKDAIDEMSVNYRRCNAQNQENYVEVWLEKAALRHIITPITDMYCKRLIVNRGYASITFLHDFVLRAQEALKAGQKPVVLYYGDWDPSGENMLYASYQTLCKELGFTEATFYRGAINPDQFHLIKADPVILKQEDKRTPEFVEKHGSKAFELDALHPEQLNRDYHG